MSTLYVGDASLESIFLYGDDLGLCEEFHTALGFGITSEQLSDFGVERWQDLR